MVKVIVGLMGSSVASGSASMSGADQLRPILVMLKNHGIRELDTARVYNAGKSEEDVGAVPEAKEDFSIATKAPGFSPGSLSYGKVIENCHASLKAMKQEKIDLYYFHGPDRQTPLEESCKAMQQLYQDGKIGSFGVSNFNAQEVEEMQTICSKNDWIKPTVYQGCYNALARTGETALFPTLRKYDMAFYAYSPLAGSFFSKTSEQLRAPPANSRMNQMKHFATMFVNDVSLPFHDKLTQLCNAEDIRLTRAALRWLMHHSILGKDDAVILGGSNTVQMEENVKACEAGPLPQNIVDCFEEMWRAYQEAGKAPPASV